MFTFKTFRTTKVNPAIFQRLGISYYTRYITIMKASQLRKCARPGEYRVIISFIFFFFYLLFILVIIDIAMRPWLSNTSGKRKSKVYSYNFQLNGHWFARPCSLPACLSLHLFTAFRYECFISHNLWKNYSLVSTIDQVVVERNLIAYFV